MKKLITCTLALSLTLFAVELKENMTIKFNGLEYKTVKSPKDGKIWLDRNLGATQICKSSDDSKCFGDLYQWGRNTDGHEKRNSTTTITTSKTNIVGHTKFITPHDWPVDWKEKTTNKESLRENPCPKGFKIPSTDDFVKNAVQLGAFDAQGMFEGFLKLPQAGHRDHWGGDLILEGKGGYYWTSNFDRDTSFFFFINKDNVNPFAAFRGFGFSIRCVENK